MLVARNICAFSFIVLLGLGAFWEPLLFPVGLAALVGYFFFHFMILNKNRSQSSHKKPTCVTVWGIIHILPLLCLGVSLPFMLIYPGGFSGLVNEINNTGYADESQFSRYLYIAMLLDAVYAGAAGFAVLFSLGWGRVHMIRSMQIQIALLLISYAVDYYFRHKYSFSMWEPLDTLVLFFSVASVLLALWCISNMRRSDVVAYFSRHSNRSRKRNSGRGKSSRYDGDDPADWWKR